MVRFNLIYLFLSYLQYKLVYFNYKFLCISFFFYLLFNLYIWYRKWNMNLKKKKIFIYISFISCCGGLVSNISQAFWTTYLQMCIEIRIYFMNFWGFLLLTSWIKQWIKDNNSKNIIFLFSFFLFFLRIVKGVKSLKAKNKQLYIYI